MGMDAPRDPHAADTTTRAQPAQAMPPLWRRWLPALLGAVAGLALCAAGLSLANALTPRVPAPDPTAHALCAALTQQDYAAMYNLLAPGQRAQGTAAQFAAAQRQRDALRGKVTACAYQLVRQDADSAWITLTLSRASTDRHSAHVRLILVERMWRVGDYTEA